MNADSAVKTLLAVIVIAMAAVADLARAQGWSEPQRVSADDAVSAPDLLFDRFGRGLAIWARTTNGVVPVGTRTAFMPPNAGAFRAERSGDAELTSGIGDSAGYAAGRLMRVERRIRCVGCRRPRATLYLQYGRFYDGSLLAERVLRRTGRIDSQSIAANGLGDAVIAWSELARDGGAPRAYAVTRHRGRLTKPRRISPPGATRVDTAIADTDGDALVAWIRRGRVEARAYRARGGWGPVQRLGLAPSGGALTAAVSRAGRHGVVAWRDLEPVCADGGCGPGEGNPTRVRAAWGRLARSFSPPLVLDEYTDLAGEADAGPVLAAFGESSVPYVAWAGVGPDRRYRTNLARVRAGAVLSRDTISPPGEGTSLAGLAASRGGGPSARVAVAWVGANSRELFAATGPQGATPPGPAQSVSGPAAAGPPGWGRDVELAFAPRSHTAVLVWRAGAGGISRGIYAATGR